MSEKTYNTRIIHKHDIEENWNKAVNFIPKVGELIVYDADENYSYSRVKMGDGINFVIDLPFIGEEKANKDEATFIYQQPEEPDNAPVGALWVDTDEESSSGGSGLPDIEEAQEGSFLKVVNGEPTWVNIPKTTETYKTTLLVSNWSEYVPFEQVSQVEGLLSTDYPFVDIDLSEVEDAQNVIDGWNLVGRVTVNSDNSIIAYCYSEKPTVDIPIVFKVVR